MPKKKTKEDFIKESTEKHGNKYDYSKVEYVNAHTKVCIICPEHGEFEQAPTNHLSGNGCPTCGLEKIRESLSSPKEDFIEKARKVHGNKYDYAKVDYVNAHTKVCIICPKHDHGEFWQTPNNHLNDRGCPKCGDENRSEKQTSTKEEFTKKANDVHGDKYDYSKVNYVNNQAKVCIICPEHGEFWQISSDHTNGRGCPKCGHIVSNDSKRSSLSDFIKKGRKIHGDKYDYSKVKYVNANTKVCIICPEHGEFWQRPADHTKGYSCQKCSGKYVPTTEEWIASAREVHKGKYDYSKVKYVNSRTKVCIICPEHGKFWQEAKSHLNGCGCLKCNLSHLEHSLMNYLDEHGITYDHQKRFDWLGRQSLDFYLPEYNVGIECQGGQHFFPVKYFGGEDGFKQTLERDKRKKKLCEENGVKLLYFGNIPNYDTFLGEVVHDDVQYLIDYLNEHKKENT